LGLDSRSCLASGALPCRTELLTWLQVKPSAKGHYGVRPIRVKTDLEHAGAGANCLKNSHALAKAAVGRPVTDTFNASHATALRRGAVVSADLEPAPITIRQQCTQSSLVATDNGMLCPSKDPAEDVKPRHASEQRRVGHLHGGCTVGPYREGGSSDAGAVAFMDADEKMAAVTCMSGPGWGEESRE
jgi:hypothetical protein